LAKLLQSVQSVRYIRIEEQPALRLSEEPGSYIEYAFVDQVVEAGRRICATYRFPFDNVPSLE
jgi:hypothetical protein